VLDLGHPLSTKSPTWSGQPVYSRAVTADLAKDGYTAGRFSTDEHFGTHIDAPAHFGGPWTVDQIPVDRLVRPAVCINVTAQASRDEDYRVSVADLKDWEQQHGAIPAGAVVLIATGWDARWADPTRYMNVRDGLRHFPGLSVDAARYLAVDRRVAGIGIDTASIDYGPSEKFEAHQTTMKLSVYHIENAANLTRLPPTGFTVVVAPIDIEGGSGGPTRLFALLR
jgi:kynurenine formamidase